MKVLKYAAGAAIGSGLVIGSMIGGGAAQADTAIDAQTHTKYAYGPYTSDQCHTVLMNHPALTAAHQANPGAGSPGACISRGGGYYLYTNVRLA